ncbi:transmembrane protein, putative (macronuclear) [Tetrahymena thermophila SB210]|uniref:Transmembrane protein, putative n=1 Tax=Tetrahymena thermophila (strain SB210) TaxID=312017 RepID=Q22CA1_TETTS|nr:transmembrane protein, putative [Tetrahymena thermophila SB210]EAR82906.1 transmembrane protein, putative [Tetrahymena thermophila SB210]|eukprot:XP_001030569.1 transmembrane protein, putative [Tetrahymena thermophila SB210]
MLRFTSNFAKICKQGQVQPISFLRRQNPSFYFSAEKQKDDANLKNQQVQVDSQDRLSVFRNSLITTGIAVTATHFTSISTLFLGPIILFPIGGYYTYKYLYKLERNSFFEFFYQLRQMNDAKSSPATLKVIDFFEKVLIERFGEVEKLDQQKKKQTLAKLVLSLAAFTSIFHVLQSYLLVLSSGLFFYSAYSLSKSFFKNQDAVDNDFTSLKWAILKIGLPNYLLNIGVGFASFVATGNMNFFCPVSSLFFTAFWTWGLYRLIKESDLFHGGQNKIHQDNINLSISPFCYVTQLIDIFILLNTRTVIYTAIKENYKELRKLLNI